jgi:hypothetical protein
VTIALGILASGGIVLAADAQETDIMGFKDYALKIHHSLGQPWGAGVSSRSVVAITGAGPGFHIDAISSEIISLADSRTDWTLAAFEPQLEQCVQNFFQKHVLPFLPHINNSFDLIVAAQFDGMGWMWANETTVVKRSVGLEAVGTGRNYAKVAIQTRVIHPNLETAVILAIQGVAEAARFDQYCGKGTSITCLRDNQAVHIPWYLIEPVEKLLGRYSGIEQSAFQYIIGHFQPDYERTHLRKMSNSYRKARSEFKAAAEAIAAKISKDG